ncbi:hypothetical protein BS50DRAFT_232530 [Corynespora cassiicola Philippines]|uniref:Uncharacterized protein n=1 Tax=Corynespora cassiicola Philippines TaxID=1448308 RepID=A0A2T2P1U0_CORCC|nr:hypothetical protein BS50DRAFT_232530 [Corynespora cassiicola Philippines]
MHLPYTTTLHFPNLGLETGDSHAALLLALATLTTPQRSAAHHVWTWRHTHTASLVVKAPFHITGSRAMRACGARRCGAVRCGGMSCSAVQCSCRRPLDTKTLARGEQRARARRFHAPLPYPTIVLFIHPLMRLAKKPVAVLFAGRVHWLPGLLRT